MPAAGTGIWFTRSRRATLTPFRSLGEFVNRRLTTDKNFAVYGALQAALEDPEVEINNNYRADVSLRILHDGQKKSRDSFEQQAGNRLEVSVGAHKLRSLLHGTGRYPDVICRNRFPDGAQVVQDFSVEYAGVH